MKPPGPPASGDASPSVPTRTFASTAPFGLSHDAWGRLVLIDADGKRHVAVEPVRAFPISDPTRWIALCDPQGREILCVDALAELTPAVRQVLEDDLALREFVPVIKRIVRVSREMCPAEWDVETDRGRTRFTLDSEDDVRRIGPIRVLISDAHRLRYHIPDMSRLDHASKRILDRYL